MIMQDFFEYCEGNERGCRYYSAKYREKFTLSKLLRTVRRIDF